MILPADMLINSVLYLLVIFVFVLIGPGVIMGIIGQNRKIMGKFYMKKLTRIFYWLSLIFVVFFGVLAII